MLYSCRWAYVKLLNPEDTMGECFPSYLRNRWGAQHYVQTFLAAFNQANLTQGEQHVLRACCLLAIPPPSPGARGIIIMPPVDLSMVGLVQLALYVEDLTSGMGTLSPHVVENTNVICNRLLPHLETSTGVSRCPKCLHPQGRCSCQGTPLHMSYSQLQSALPAFTMLASGASSMVQSASSRSTVVVPGTPLMASPRTASGMPHSMNWASMAQPTFPTPSQATTPQSYQHYPHGGQAGVPQTRIAAPPPVRQPHSSTQSAQQLPTPYMPQAKAPKTVSFGKGVIPAGAESSYLNQPTYAGKASQPPPQERESRRDAHKRRTPPNSYSALRKKVKNASQRPQSQSGARTNISSSAITSAQAKRIVEVLQPPHEYNSAGWNQNTEHILDYFLYKEVHSLTPEERAKIVDDMLARMDELDEMKLWFFKWEKWPLSFMTYLSEVVDRFCGYQLVDICLYMRWI